MYSVVKQEAYQKQMPIYPNNTENDQNQNAETPWNVLACFANGQISEKKEDISKVPNVNQEEYVRSWW